MVPKHVAQGHALEDIHTVSVTSSHITPLELDYARVDQDQLCHTRVGSTAGKLRIPHTHAHTDGVVVVGTHAHVGWANAPCSKTHMRIHSHVNCTRSHKTLSCQDHDSTTLIDCHHNFSNR